MVVTDSAGNKLHQFTPSVATITGLAVDSSNNILITWTDFSLPDFKRYLKKYDLNGTFISDLVTYGDEDGNPADADPNDLNTYDVVFPENPFIGNDGSIYVSVHGSGSPTVQIRKYSTAGTLLDTIGTVQGSNDGEMNGNQNFFVESDGSVYVVDTWTDRLQKFDANGNFVSKITWPKQVSNSITSSLIREPDGSFVVIERMGAAGRMTAFSSSGVLKWVKDGSERNDTAYPTYDSNEMSIAKYNGQYYLGFMDEVVIYNTDGSYVGRHAKKLNGPNVTIRLVDGTFFVGTARGIHKYSAKGEWQLSFAPERMIYGLAASNTVVYATDPVTAGLIYKYDFDGNLLGTINYGGVGQPIGLALDKNGNLFVGDVLGLFKIPTSTEIAAPFGVGAFTTPIGMVPLDDGSIVFMDHNVAGTVPRKLNADGTLAALTFDTAGPAEIMLGYNIATDSTGKFYVADSVTNKIVVFNSDGTYSKTFSGGNLNQPLNIFIDKYDDIFVPDSQNNVVKKFSSVDGSLQAE